MIISSNSKCKILNCKEKALYGINFKPIHCEIHKTEDDLNLCEKKCTSCNLLYVLDFVNIVIQYLLKDLIYQNKNH